MDTSPPASPDLPDVRLLAGSLSWRVWSTDPDNPGGIGDIGVISSPAAANFAVTLRDPSNGPGARNVKAIRLQPTNPANYANLPDLSISGVLTEELVVQATGGAEGVAALDVASVTGLISARELTLLADELVGDLTIHGTTDLLIVQGGVAEGANVVVDELDDGMIGDVDGSLTIGKMSGSGNTVVFAPALAGSLTVNEFGGPSVSRIVFVTGIAASGFFTIGTSTAPGVDIQVGQDVFSEMAGIIAFNDGFPVGMGIWVPSVFRGLISLDGADIDGSLLLAGGGDGSIIDAGVVNGTVTFGQDVEFMPYSEFTGTAEFASIGNGAIFASGLPGSITIDGDIGPDGAILASGGITGLLDIGGTLNGQICAENLTPGQPVPDNIDIATWGATGEICGVAACSTVPGGVAAEPSPVSKNRFLSFVPPHIPGQSTALRVKMVSMPDQFFEFEGRDRWLAAPAGYSEGGSGPADFQASALGCQPVLHDWNSVPVVHAFGAEVVPGAVYEVRAEIGSCQSARLTVTTALWGDVATPFGPGFVNFADISAVVSKFETPEAPGVIPKVRGSLQPNIPRPGQFVDFRDISYCLWAFAGNPYPFSGPEQCP